MDFPKALPKPVVSISRSVTTSRRAATEPRIRLPISHLIENDPRFSFDPIYTSSGEYGFFVKQSKNTRTFVCYNTKRNIEVWSVEKEREMYDRGYVLYVIYKFINDDQFIYIERRGPVDCTDVYFVTTGEKIASFEGCGYGYMHDVDMWCRWEKDFINIYNRRGDFVRRVSGLEIKANHNDWVMYNEKLWCDDGKMLHFIDNDDSCNLHTYDISGEVATLISTTPLFDEEQVYIDYKATRDEVNILSWKCVIVENNSIPTTYLNVFDKHKCAITQTFVVHSSYSTFKTMNMIISHLWNKFLVMGFTSPHSTLLVCDPNDNVHPVMKLQSDDPVFSTCIRYTKLHEGWFVFEQLIAWIKVISRFSYPFMTVDLVSFFARNALLNLFLSQK